MCMLFVIFQTNQYFKLIYNITFIQERMQDDKQPKTKHVIGFFIITALYYYYFLNCISV